LKDSKIDIRDAFFDELYDLARKDKDVIFLTADSNNDRSFTLSQEIK